MEPRDFDLLLRSLDQKLSGPEQDRMQRLLHTSPEARARLDELHGMRRLVATHGAGSFGPAFAARLKQRLRPATGTALSLRWPIRYAGARLAWPQAGLPFAVVLVLVGIGLALWVRPTTVTVPHGERAVLTLPDGSTAELSPGTTLSYRNAGFGKLRRLRLEGEAFFSVVKDEAPFVVATFNARVTVRGTRFNVRAWPSEPVRQTTVTLTDGLLEVTPEAAPEQAVLLDPGQQTAVVGDSAAPLPPEPARLEHALAWRRGALAFRDQPLAAVLAELERRFAVQIEAPSPTLSSRRVTYLQPNPSTPEDVLADLCYVLDLRYRRTAHGFAVLSE